MITFICDTCGYTFDKDTSADRTTCPICKGNSIPETSYKEREELSRQIEQDNKDDDFTPAQDAREEAVDLIIIDAMNINMIELGNNKLFMKIEDLPNAEQRAKFRKYFLMVGGQVPEGEPITI